MATSFELFASTFQKAYDSQIINAQNTAKLMLEKRAQDQRANEFAVTAAQTDARNKIAELAQLSLDKVHQSTIGLNNFSIEQTKALATETEPVRTKRLLVEKAQLDQRLAELNPNSEEYKRVKLQRDSNSARYTAMTVGVDAANREAAANNVPIAFTIKDGVTIEQGRADGAFYDKGKVNLPSGIGTSEFAAGRAGSAPVVGASPVATPAASPLDSLRTTPDPFPNETRKLNTAPVIGNSDTSGLLPLKDRISLLGSLYAKTKSDIAGFDNRLNDLSLSNEDVQSLVNGRNTALDMLSSFSPAIDKLSSQAFPGTVEEAAIKSFADSFSKDASVPPTDAILRARKKARNPEADPIMLLGPLGRF